MLVYSVSTCDIRPTPVGPDGKDWDVSPVEPNHLGSKTRDNVVVYQGKVYISTDLLNTLATGYNGDPDAKIGRRLLYSFDRLYDRLVERTSFPRRSWREERVAQRNTQIIEWLLSLV